MSPPLIGLTTYRERARWGVWDTSADVLPAQYADSLRAVGGVPVLLPPQDPSSAATLVGRLDGLVVSGGADIEPARYGAEPHPATAQWRPDRDAWELALLDAADGPGLPVLGICRGMQVMAVRRGGTLDQHLPDSVGHDGHSPGGDVFGLVSIRTVAGSRLRSLVGERHEVGCHHHQAVREHPGYRSAAHSEDGTTEALEAAGERFEIAVQWHPETRSDAGLFRGLVDAAAAHAL